MKQSEMSLAEMQEMVIDYVDTQAQIKNLDRKRKAGTTGFLKTKRDTKPQQGGRTALLMYATSAVNPDILQENVMLQSNVRSVSPIDIAQICTEIDRTREIEV